MERSNFKKILFIIIGLSLVFGLSACGKESKDRKENDKVIKQQFPDSYPVLEELDWSISNGIRYDEPAALFSYTNNSEYVIVTLEMDFSLKQNYAQEELKVFDDIKTKYSYTDDEIAEMNLWINDCMVCDIGETVEGAPCYLNSFIEASDVSQCEIMELVSAKIYFLGEDGNIYRVDYVEEGNIYDVSDVYEVAFGWSDSEYAKSLPTPDSRVVSVDFDEEDYFQATVYDTTFEKYTLYIEKCKNKGFNKDLEESDITFWGTNELGMRLHVRFLRHMNAMEISIE